MNIEEFKKTKHAEFMRYFMNDMPIQDRQVLWGFISTAIIDEMAKLITTEQARSVIEPEVKPNEVVGGGLIAYQLTEDNKEFLYKKFAQHRLNLIVASHNQTLQYAKLEDGRNADYGDWIIEVNGKLIFLKEYNSRREA